MIITILFFRRKSLRVEEAPASVHEGGPSPLTDPGVQDYRTRFLKYDSPHQPKGERYTVAATDGGSEAVRRRAS